ncbi:MAG: DNA-3-methyladenine glycosylase [Acidobacteriota bacterium]|nr:DNA-3-methyladenine glycosylase [Acidobacteriota bacterium]
MKARRLGRSFYFQPTLKVARELLGKYIVRKVGSEKLSGKIIETEAYVGPQDKASHAYGGKVTPRNWVEYLAGGRVYIYLVYGMYWQLNIITGQAGKPECVLIRALEVPGEDKNIASGPGKLCRYLQLDKSFYGEDLVRSKIMWVEDRGEQVKPGRVKRTPRIGIDYAGTYWSQKKWRFLLRPEKTSGRQKGS